MKSAARTAKRLQILRVLNSISSNPPKIFFNSFSNESSSAFDGVTIQVQEFPGLGVVKELRICFRR